MKCEKCENSALLLLKGLPLCVDHYILTLPDKDRLEWEKLLKGKPQK
tara:strand:- start:376 stop:516 length:141 start_codon:yes stop_codon:yes gene_type:complete